MAKIGAEQPLVPSVLDRLLDFDRGASVESLKSQLQVLSELRETVRRDLADILNTHARCCSWPADFTELVKSPLNVGVPDTATAYLGREQGRLQMVKHIEKTIRLFEPRFKTVKVTMLENSDPLDRTYRFRIDALMHAYPAPEPVVFDSALQPITGIYSVQRGTR